jgi:general secretion pathway protein M
MKAWFLSLQDRERWILAGGAGAALVIMLWWLVLLPLSDGSADLREVVTDKQRLLVDLRRAEAIAPDAGARGGNAGGQSLVVLVDSTAQAFGLALPRTRPDGPAGINVSFQGVSFDALLAWLIELDGTHSVRVESASFSSARERGLVNGQLFLRRM